MGFLCSSFRFKPLAQICQRLNNQMWILMRKPCFFSYFLPCSNLILLPRLSFLQSPASLLSWLKCRPGAKCFLQKHNRTRMWATRKTMENWCPKVKKVCWRPWTSDCNSSEPSMNIWDELDHMSDWVNGGAQKGSDNRSELVAGMVSAVSHPFWCAANHHSDPPVPATRSCLASTALDSALRPRLDHGLGDTRSLRANIQDTVSMGH